MKIEKINMVNATFANEVGEYTLSADVQMRGDFVESIMSGEVKKGDDIVARFTSRSEPTFDVTFSSVEKASEITEVVKAYLAEARAFAQTEPIGVKNI